MMTTATSAMAATSAADRMPGPLAKAERLVMPTSCPSAARVRNSGMASVSLMKTSPGSALGQGCRGRRELALLLAHDVALDRVHQVEHLARRHDLEGARAGERHAILARHAARSRR